MIDPSNALQSFQQEFSLGNLKLQPGTLYPGLFVHVQPLGNTKFRMTYVQLENLTVTSFVNFVPCDQIENIPCFQVGYAVPAGYRNQGRAKEAIKMALAEMKFGYQRAGITKFFIEAIVEQSNKSSLRVAEQTISETPISMVDQFSNMPSFQYLRKIE